MSSYIFFLADKQYETENGAPCSLGEHLDYCDQTGGTADCWDRFDGTRKRAMNEATESGLDLYIVDEANFRVVAHVNYS